MAKLLSKMLSCAPTQPLNHDESCQYHLQIKKSQIILPKIYELFSMAKHNNKNEKENMLKERKGNLLEANWNLKNEQLNKFLGAD